MYYNNNHWISICCSASAVGEVSQVSEVEATGLCSKCHDWTGFFSDDEDGNKALESYLKG